MITIRKEESRDRQAVHQIYKAAFGQPDEADLVDRLRKSNPDRLALVAEEIDRVVGQILFTPATIAGDDGSRLTGMGLAPVAVTPDLQGRGIGGKLIIEGLAILKNRQCPFVIVLGQPQYYPRFGFVPAGNYNIRCQWPEVPPEAFMILVLDQEAMRPIGGGVASFSDELNRAV